MNQSLGLLGRKMGCTQVFNDEGLIERVTVLSVGPCTIVRKRTVDRDGYSALVLGFEDKPEKLVTRPELGPYVKDDGELKQASVRPKRILREFRVPVEVADSYEVGQTVNVQDVFESGQKVDVTGTTKGRGFTGVVKRHGFKGARATHGTHEFFRHGGAIGQCMTPGRTFKGVKMPGHHGSSRKTVQNLRVVGVQEDRNLLLVRGAVPGHTRAMVMVRLAVKKKNEPASS
jgi:large subunit ribosomal protein L3